MSAESDAGGDAGDGRSDAQPAARRGLNHQPVNWLLLIPLAGTLVPFFYNFTSPTLGGIPFFYWYQLLWIPLSVIVTMIVFRATRNER